MDKSPKGYVTAYRLAVQLDPDGPVEYIGPLSVSEAGKELLDWMEYARRRNYFFKGHIERADVWKEI